MRANHKLCKVMKFFFQLSLNLSGPQPSFYTGLYRQLFGRRHSMSTSASIDLLHALGGAPLKWPLPCRSKRSSGYIFTWPWLDHFHRHFRWHTTTEAEISFDALSRSMFRLLFGHHIMLRICSHRSVGVRRLHFPGFASLKQAWRLNCICASSKFFNIC